MLGRNVGGKSFVADRRINERRREGGKQPETQGAEGAALFVLIRLRRVPVALVPDRFGFHLRAAARFLNSNERFPRDHGESDRAGEEQAEQKSQHGSHDDSVYHLMRSRFNPRLKLGAERHLCGIAKIKKMFGAMPGPNDPRPTPNPFPEATLIGDYDIKGAWRRGNVDGKLAHYSSDDWVVQEIASLAKAEDTLEVRLTNVDNEGGSDRITFACDLSGRYNPYPMVEPVVRETKFC